MRYARFLIVALVVATSFLFWQGREAYAAFHCMRIHAVMAGFNSDNTIQYVELRMNIGGQTLVGGHVVRFYDSAGTLKATFTFSGGVASGATGDSILIGTSEFNATTNGGDANFTFSMANTVGANGGDPLHPVQGPAGKVTFAEGAVNCTFGGPLVVDSVAYGGGGYTGAVDYGSAAVALPGPSNNQALRVGNLALEPTNNSTEYSLQAVSATTFSVPVGSLATDLATPRNNGRVVLQLQGAPPTATPTPTPTPTITPTPIPVGGIVEQPGAAAGAAQAGGSSGGDTGVFIAIGAAVGAVALGGGLWIARRRRGA